MLHRLTKNHRRQPASHLLCRGNQYYRTNCCKLLSVENGHGRNLQAGTQPQNPVRGRML